MKVDGQPREPIGAIYSNPCCKTRCCAEDIVEAYMTNGKHGQEEIQIGEPFFADTPPTPSSSFMTRCHSNSCQKLSGSVLRRAMLSLGPGLHALRDYAGQLLLLPHNHSPGMLRRAVLSPASTTRVLYLLPLRVLPLCTTWVLQTVQPAPLLLLQLRFEMLLGVLQVRRL